MSIEADYSLLEALLLARGPGGNEQEVRSVCRRELEASCDKVWLDAADNLVGLIRAEGAPREAATAGAMRVMAHQDEIDMVVKRIGDDGRLHVVALGGAFPVNFGMCPVDVLGETDVLPGVLSFGTMHGTAESTQSMHILSGNVQWSDVHVITRRTPEALAQMGVRPGTRVVLSQHWRRPFRVNDAIAAHFLDDRAPLVAVLRAAEQLASCKSDLKQDLYIVLTTNEEETNSGAQYAARTLPGSVCIAVEVGPIAEEYATRLCADPIILTGDEKGLYTKSITDGLLAAAIRCGYTPQPALMPGFASDASAVLGSGSSPRAGCLAIPTENTHGYELITEDAMQACTRTLVAYLLNAGEH
ncbi:M20/M25/M40 family metallo-hydrolase [Pseudomonas sp.]|uniref:M20/M25/M40 family metallo-hydrolase n=1 Tax=Pseudomonas sp. TaxID=306 RepID=UPI0028A82937|nr:M20/M25/M40 family metallo-hydrolase [Pseudomonas sp.]